MNVDGEGELGHCLRDGNKRVKGGVVGEEQGLLEEKEVKVNAIDKDVKDGAVQTPALLQITQQQQPHAAMVCWERFLHLRSLNVLLVENDDSTRLVVTAFLRNCSYDVVEAANGLQAWKILEDLTNHIDLILTEVVMPCLSGIGLLCKIMSHKTRRNTPVIMMSSHDSMGLVFKCLSKGAVDFLVKPIRKNELKNLWQHVWRRCHSSSDSGSESGTQTQKSVKSKVVEKSENNTGSNDEDDNGSIGLNAGDGSDNGSGTQSSWTKKTVEVESPQPMSLSYRVAEYPDSTCAQVIHSNAEISSNKWVPVTAARKCQEQEEQHDNVALDKDPEIGVPRNLDLQLECPIEVPIKLVGTKQNNLLEMGSSKLNEQMDKGQLDLNSESPDSKLKYEAANLAGVITSTADPQVDITEYEAPKRLFKISDVNNKALNDSKEPPPHELSLKRFRGVKDTGTTVQDDRNVLRRSDSSAFSRYNTASNANKAPSGNIGSTSPLDSCLELTKKGSVYDIRSHLSDPSNQCSNGGSNNIDMGSTTNNAFKKPVVLKSKTAVTSTVKCLHPSSAFQPAKNDLLCAPQPVVLDKADEVGATTVLAQPRGTQQELQIQHLPHHYDRHHLVHNMQQKQQQQQLPSNYDDLSLKKMAAAAPHCGSSNVLGPIEGNPGNCSVNRSASGSNHGSNGQYGSSTAVNTGGMNMESDNGFGERSGSGDASGNGSGDRVDQSKYAQREAALTKFSQKRKERFFRKKVQYQSRKRLAETTTPYSGTIYAAVSKREHKQCDR